LVLKRYTNDEIILLSVSESAGVVKELEKVMHFYVSNLIINVIINGVTYQFLDLLVTLDDLTLVEWGCSLKNSIILLL